MNKRPPFDSFSPLYGDDEHQHLGDYGPIQQEMQASVAQTAPTLGDYLTLLFIFGTGIVVGFLLATVPR